jgi:hypothetical protein
MEGTIYKITGGGLTYYGSTKQDLGKRYSCHKAHFKAYKNGKGNFMSSFKVLEQNDARIEAVEHLAYNTKKELLGRERFFIVNNDCVNIIYKPISAYKGWDYTVNDVNQIIERNREYFRKKQDANPNYKIETDFYI